jgi:hypothetical protein
VLARNGHVVEEDVAVRVPTAGHLVIIEQEAGPVLGPRRTTEQSGAGPE